MDPNATYGTEMVYVPLYPQTQSQTSSDPYQNSDLETPFTSEESLIAPTPSSYKIPATTPREKLTIASLIILSFTTIVHAVIYLSMEISGTVHFKDFLIWDLGVLILIMGVIAMFTIIIITFCTKIGYFNPDGLCGRVRSAFNSILSIILITLVFTSQGGLVSCVLFFKDECHLMFSLGLGFGPEKTYSGLGVDSFFDFMYLLMESVVGFIAYNTPFLTIVLLGMLSESIFKLNERSGTILWKVVLIILICLAIVMFFGLLVFLYLNR